MEAFGFITAHTTQFRSLKSAEVFASLLLLLSSTVITHRFYNDLVISYDYYRGDRICYFLHTIISGEKTKIEFGCQRSKDKSRNENNKLRRLLSVFFFFLERLGAAADDRHCRVAATIWRLN